MMTMMVCMYSTRGSAHPRASKAPPPFLLVGRGERCSRLLPDVKQVVVFCSAAFLLKHALARYCVCIVYLPTNSFIHEACMRCCCTRIHTSPSRHFIGGCTYLFMPAVWTTCGTAVRLKLSKNSLGTEPVTVNKTR